MPRAKNIEKHAAVEADLRAGNMTNAEIQEKHGVSPTTLWRIRHDAGIEPQRSIPVAGYALLGKQADAELAQKWAVTRQAVAKARKAAGIPSFTSVERARIAATPTAAHDPL